MLRLQLLFLFLSSSSSLIRYCTSSSPPGCRTRTCGEVNIRYPFWLADEIHHEASSSSSYCGYPGFNISCRDGKSPILRLDNHNYTVTDISYETQTILLADSDVISPDAKCPRIRHNLSLEDDERLFSSAPGDVTLFFLFNCSTTPDLSRLSRITCFGATTGLYNYVFLEDKKPEFYHDHFLEDNNRPVPTCQDVVAATVLRSAVPLHLIDNVITWLVDGFVGALKGGFQLQWRNFTEHGCDDCENSGGLCGYNMSSSTNTCYCGDGIRDWPCDKNRKTKKILIGVGAGVGGFILASVLCFVWFRWKKQRHLPPSTAYFRSTVSSTPSYKDPELGSNSLHTHLFSYEELQEATNNFDESRAVGDGGYGTVYKGKLQDGRVVAVKQLYDNNYKRVEQFINEVEILSQLRHPNLVSLYGCTSYESHNLLLVYEYIPNGTVADHLHGPRAPEGGLTWPIRLNIAIETADALSYLHAVEPPIIHRDVKSNNILLDLNFVVKVADFGLSRLFPFDVSHVSTAPQGTPGYLDPQYHQFYQLTDKSDVYSFGVVLVELISSQPAVDITRKRNEINLASMAISRIQNGELDRLVDPKLGFVKDAEVRRMITGVAELAFRCLQNDSDMRPPIKEVMEVLREIKYGGFGASKSVRSERNLKEDTRALIKNKIENRPESPKSVQDRWESSRTTPNNSG